MHLSRDRLIIVASLAVGTALLVAMLSLMFAVVIAPLPFAQGNRIVTVTTVQDGSPVSSSFADYRDLARSGGPLANSIYVQSLIGNTEIDGHPESLSKVRFEGDVFAVFQRAPLLGDPGDLNSHRRQDAPTAVLSYSAWSKVFGRDSHVLGKTIRIGANLYQVRAVLPREYELVLPAGIWVAKEHEQPGERDNRDGHIYARLASGGTVARANAYLQSTAASLQKEASESNQGVTFTSALLKDSLAGQSKTGLYLLVLSAAGVLWVAYFNVYQLLAAKAVAASPRWSLCLALGASGRRLFQDMLKEPLLLGLGGCGFGLLLGIVSLSTLRSLGPNDIPRIGETRLVWQVAVASLLISILAAVLFASLMVMRTLSLGTRHVLLHGGVSGGASIRHAFAVRKQFVLIAQIGLSTTLLILMGMLATAFRQTTRSPLGFEGEGVSVTDLALKEPTNTVAGAEYVRQIMQRLSNLPGVQEVASASNVPFQKRSYTAKFSTEEMPQKSAKELQFVAVSPQFFRTLQIRLLKGRTFTDSDNSSSPRVAILNHAAGLALFGSADGLNRQVKADLGPSASVLQVVGVVDSVRQDPTTVITPPIVYLPLDQSAMYSVSLVIRAHVPVGTADIKSRIWSVNRSQAVQETAQLADLIDISLRRIRYTAFLMVLFAAVTMLLSALGIYAAVTQWLSASQKEIALRVALGATYSQIRSSVLRRVMVVTAVALAFGAIVALAASNTINSLLYGVRPDLIAVLAAAVLLLSTVAFLSSYIPALRTKFIDPIQLLRAE